MAKVQEKRPTRGDSNGVYKVESVMTRIETSRGVVLQIDGISPALWQRFALQAQEKYPLPPSVKAVYYIDRSSELTRSEEEVLDPATAQHWEEKHPDLNRGLLAKFERWLQDTMTAHNRQMAFLMTEAIRCGVTVDIEATKANGAPVPDMDKIDWRDKVPRHDTDDGAGASSEWEQYLEYAIGTSQDYSLVSVAMRAMLNTPTEEGVQRAIDSFRTAMERGAIGELETVGETSGAEAETGQATDIPIDARIDETGSDGVEDAA